MDSGFTGLCKTWGARWSVEHTALWLIHILLFQWKMHVLLILELLEYYIFPISMCYSLFYSICWRIWEKNWTVSSFVYCSRNLPAMADPFLWYISLCDHIYMWAKIFFSFLSSFFFSFWLKEAVEVNNVFIVQQKGKVRHVVVIDIIWKHLESVRLPNHPDQIKKRWTQDYINKLSKAHPTSFTCESAFWPEKIELQLNTDG